jgi:hypothetical protein
MLPKQGAYGNNGDLPPYYHTRTRSQGNRLNSISWAFYCGYFTTAGSRSGSPGFWIGRAGLQLLRPSSYGC